ncbi:MAG: PAS domain S-box protein [Chloroflexi bacterium]|uniref:PAS domain-containing sensor histidine kinase n=1 Tax=Candidatus Flexifilum breve TaxID=3140694 RepID=UPI0031372A16|nr:PAS domain S-box protein [Chloroflexota bacterium]
MDSKQQKLDQLRTRAENVLTQLRMTPSTAGLSIDELVHELTVYQVELEIQLEDLQHAYQAAEKAQERYTHLFDFAPVGYIVTNAEGLTLKGNLTAASMIGVDRTLLEKQPFADFIVGVFQDIYHLHRRSVLRTQQTQTCEVQIQRVDGTIFHAQLCTDVPATADDSEALRTAITNISAIKQAEEAVRRALGHEKEMNDMRTRVLSIIAHEFRTPLAAILASAETLERYGDRLSSDKKAARFHTIRNFVWYLNDTVQNAVIVQQGEEQLHVKPETFDVIAFVRQVVNDMGALGKPDQQIALEVTSDGEQALVTWDTSLMRSSLMNVLSNALKYSQGSTLCRLECEETVIRLQVQDHGIGISADDQPYVFDAFFRGQNTQYTSGMGIGLYIVQRAVQAHGGSIRCTSQLGQGTLITIELPRHAEHGSGQTGSTQV